MGDWVNESRDTPLAFIVVVHTYTHMCTHACMSDRAMDCIAAMQEGALVTYYTEVR